MADAKKGTLIVLEGLDGSGKATQAKLLAQHLKEAGKNVQEITFPDYASDSSALVKMYLAGQFGDKPDDVNAYAASSFYAVDRYASYKTSWGSFYEAGGVIIADRYTTSNAVHQCSKLPPEQWESFLQWLFDYEFRLLGLPAPDEVIYLQVDPAVSQKLMTGRYHGDESKKRRPRKRRGVPGPEPERGGILCGPSGLGDCPLHPGRCHAEHRGHPERSAEIGPAGYLRIKEASYSCIV